MNRHTGEVVQVAAQDSFSLIFVNISPILIIRDSTEITNLHSCSHWCNIDLNLIIRLIFTLSRARQELEQWTGVSSTALIIEQAKIYR